MELPCYRDAAGEDGYGDEFGRQIDDEEHGQGRQASWDPGAGRGGPWQE